MVGHLCSHAGGERKPSPGLLYALALAGQKCQIIAARSSPIGCFWLVLPRCVFGERLLNRFLQVSCPHLSLVAACDCAERRGIGMAVGNETGRSGWLPGLPTYLGHFLGTLRVWEKEKVFFRGRDAVKVATTPPKS